MESAKYGKISFPSTVFCCFSWSKCFPLFPNLPLRSGGFRSKCVSPDPSLDKIETEKLFWIWKANPTLWLSKTGGGIGRGLKLCQHSWIQSKKKLATIYIQISNKKKLKIQYIYLSRWFIAWCPFPGKVKFFFFYTRGSGRNYWLNVINEAQKINEGTSHGENIWDREIYFVHRCLASDEAETLDFLFLEFYFIEIVIGWE